ncbi:unnamed protein product, partial [Prorocentrum cordatum]
VCEVPDLRPGAGELREGSVLTLPVLPLRRVPLPLSEHRLPASQPEQRRLYDDLLQSGKRDFVGALSYGGRLARIGVLLHLQELSELPGMPGPGRPLWVGRLGAAGRVRLLCAQNPEAWFGRSSYLRATVELLDGAGEAAAAPAAGAQATAAAAATRAEEEGCPELRALRGSLHQVRALQARLREEAQLRPCRWEEQGIWAVCDAWREFAEARLRRQCRRQLERVVERWGERCPDGYRTVRQGRGSYPVGVSQEMGRLRDAFAARRAELGLLLQRVLEGPDLRSQAQAMRAIVEHEHKRLLAKKALAGIADKLKAIDLSQQGLDVAGIAQQLGRSSHWVRRATRHPETGDLRVRFDATGNSISQPGRFVAEYKGGFSSTSRYLLVKLPQVAFIGTSLAKKDKMYSLDAGLLDGTSILQVALLSAAVRLVQYDRQTPRCRVPRSGEERRSAAPVGAGGEQGGRAGKGPGGRQGTKHTHRCGFLCQANFIQTTASATVKHRDVGGRVLAAMLLAPCMTPGHGQAPALCPAGPRSHLGSPAQEEVACGVGDLAEHEESHQPLLRPPQALGALSPSCAARAGRELATEQRKAVEDAVSLIQRWSNVLRSRREDNKAETSEVLRETCQTLGELATGLEQAWSQSFPGEPCPPWAVEAIPEEEFARIGWDFHANRVQIRRTRAAPCGSPCPTS